MAAPHERSIGAQMERKAMRRYLRAMVKKSNARLVNALGVSRKLIDGEAALVWVLSRQKRYDKRRGGLGRK